MSRTVRRKHLNKKTRFYHYYFQHYSENEVKNEGYMPTWKYHSDNYYTKSCTYKQKEQNFAQRQLRRIIKEELRLILLEVDVENIVVGAHKLNSIIKPYDLNY